MDQNTDKIPDNETVTLGDQPDTATGASAEPASVSDGAAQDGDNSAKLAAEAAQWQDKYMRLVAEFDNYRKRTLKEKLDLVATGGEDVVKSLLVVLDDIDRAMAAIELSTDLEAMKEGVMLIHHKLMDALRSKGLEEIDSVGLDLDTDLHEAVAKIPAADPAHKGKIVDVVQKGYKLKDKVARHAKVVVGE